MKDRPGLGIVWRGGNVVKIDGGGWPVDWCDGSSIWGGAG